MESDARSTGSFIPGLIHKKHSMCCVDAITFAIILQKFPLRLSYTCVHKSGAFVLSFGVTLARIFSQLFLGQLPVFEPRCLNIGLRDFRPGTTQITQYIHR